MLKMDCYNALKKMIDHTNTDSLFELRVGKNGKVTVYDLARQNKTTIAECVTTWLANGCDFTILTKNKIRALLCNRK